MILFDFDGTIADVWARYYTVFCEIVKRKDISFREYQNVKLLLESDQKIAFHYGITLPENYHSRKLGLLETESYLALDTLFCKAEMFLDFFASYPCMILTKRNDRDTFYQQLEDLKLRGIEERCVILQPQGESKSDWIKENLPRGETHCIVGDSDEEMKCGCLENVNAFFVDTGLKRWDHLKYREGNVQVGTVMQFMRLYAKIENG